MELERLLVWFEPQVQRGFEAPPFDPGHAAGLTAAAGARAPEHLRFLQRWNGAYAYEGNLHLFGARGEPPNQSLDAWNRSDGWRQAFGPMLDGVFFFAESGFGDQFGYHQGKVVWLRASDLRIERVASSFCEWLEAVSLEPGRYLSEELFQACVARLGPLDHGGHFVPLAGYTSGSPRTADRMEVVPARDGMELKGVLASTARRSGPPPGRAPLRR